MPPIAIALVLSSAALHSLWNAVARAHDGELRSMWLLPLGGALTGFVLLNRTAFALPWPSLWPFLLASASIHSLYFLALGSAYACSDLSWSYSVSRGFSLLLVAPLALGLFGQSIPAAAWVGVLLVTLGLLLMQRGAIAQGRQHRRQAFLWALAVGGLSAAYALVDSRAVLHAPPVAYITWVFLGAGVLMTPLALRRPPAPAVGLSTLAGGVSLLSYVLMLYSYRLTPVAAALALRQVAPIFGALLGWFALRERPTRVRWLGTAAIVAGAALATLR